MTYLTNILDKKKLIELLWVFRALMVQMIKLEHGLIQKVEILKMASKMATS